MHLKHWQYSCMFIEIWPKQVTCLFVIIVSFAVLSLVQLQLCEKGIFPPDRGFPESFVIMFLMNALFQIWRFLFSFSVFLHLCNFEAAIICLEILCSLSQTEFQCLLFSRQDLSRQLTTFSLSNVLFAHFFVATLTTSKSLSFLNIWICWGILEIPISVLLFRQLQQLLSKNSMQLTDNMKRFIAW